MGCVNILSLNGMLKKKRGGKLVSMTMMKSKRQIIVSVK